MGRGLIQAPMDGNSIEDWWQQSLLRFSFTAVQRRNVAALLLYTSWNVWKENNQRNFEGTICNVPASVLPIAVRLHAVGS
jgi:hypothetical protein